jgi:hypothetical protein
MDHSTRFGLLDENTEGKVRFLHRTYAEYMMVEYLYTGFILDDDKRKQLLDFDSARKMIIDTISVKERYDGVQVFKQKNSGLQFNTLIAKKAQV